MLTFRDTHVRLADIPLGSVVVKGGGFEYAASGVAYLVSSACFGLECSRTIVPVVWCGSEWCEGRYPDPHECHSGDTLFSVVAK